MIIDILIVLAGAVAVWFLLVVLCAALSSRSADGRRGFWDDALDVLLFAWLVGDDGWGDWDD